MSALYLCGSIASSFYAHATNSMHAVVNGHHIKSGTYNSHNKVCESMGQCLITYKLEWCKSSGCIYGT